MPTAESLLTANSAPRTAEMLADWEKFKIEFHRMSGLNLGDYKFDQTYRRVWTMVERAACKSFTTYCAYLRGDQARIQEFLDALAINVSELFRNPEQFETLKTMALPVLLKKANGLPLKVWSAGCSYGAEAYSIGALLLEATPKTVHRIVGTDIDAQMLERAQEGCFDAIEMARTPQRIKQKYFIEQKAGLKTRYEAVPELKAMMRFRKHNLLAAPFERGFDLIACRNVVIYFNDQAKDKLYRKYYQSLKPGGFLFVGNTERIFNYREIGFTSPTPFFYQKPDILSKDSGEEPNG